MKNVFRSKTLIQTVSLVVFAIVVSCWQPDTSRVHQNKNSRSYGRDTTAPKSSHTNQIDIQLNLDSAMQQVNMALAKIDYNKINIEVQKALAQIDYNKINQEINAAMKNIDWNEIQTNVSVALKNAKSAVDSIRWDELKAEISKAKANIELQKINTDSIQKQVQRSLKEAQKSLQAAQKELANYKALQTALEKDGLLKAGEPHRIELKSGDLYLNGVKQTKAITEKYSRFYLGKKDFSIGIDDKEETDL